MGRGAGTLAVFVRARVARRSDAVAEMRCLAVAVDDEAGASGTSAFPSWSLGTRSCGGRAKRLALSLVDLDQFNIENEISADRPAAGVGETLRNPEPPFLAFDH